MQHRNDLKSYQLTFQRGVEKIPANILVIDSDKLEETLD